MYEVCRTVYMLRHVSLYAVQCSCLTCCANVSLYAVQCSCLTCCAMNVCILQCILYCSSCVYTTAACVVSSRLIYYTRGVYVCMYSYVYPYMPRTADVSHAVREVWCIPCVSHAVREVWPCTADVSQMSHRLCVKCHCRYLTCCA